MGRQGRRAGGRARSFCVTLTRLFEHNCPVGVITKSVPWCTGMGYMYPLSISRDLDSQ